MHRVDTGISTGKQDQRRMLVDRSQRHDRRPLSAVDDEIRGADPVSRLPSTHRLDRILARSGHAERYVEAGLAVIPLRDGGVEAGRLELVPPFELDGDRCQAAFPIGCVCLSDRGNTGKDARGEPERQRFYAELWNTYAPALRKASTYEA